MTTDTKALRALLARGTKGEWAEWRHGQRESEIARACDDDGASSSIWTTGGALRGTSDDDRALIVAAVNALPALLDEVEAQRAILGEIRPLANEDGVDRDLTPDDALARIRALVKGVATDSPVVPKQTLDEMHAENTRLRAQLESQRPLVEAAREWQRANSGGDWGDRGNAVDALLNAARRMP